MAKKKKEPRIMNRKQLAAHYEICEKTLYNWFKDKLPSEFLKSLKKSKSKVLTPKELETIYKYLGK